MPFNVDPNRKFINNKAGAVAVCDRASTRLVASVANDQVLVAEITGYSIAVCGFSCHSAGASSVVFKAGPAGTALWSTQLIAATNDLLPVLETGFYFETGGSSLVVDVATATTAINLVYITYQP